MITTDQEETIMAIFEGAGVALVTPFNADGSVNYTKLEENKFRVELKRIAQLCNLDKVDSTTMIEIEQSAQHAYYEGMR